MAHSDLSFTPYSSDRKRLHCKVLQEKWDAVGTMLFKETTDDKTKAWALLEICKYARDPSIEVKFNSFLTGEALHAGIQFLLARSMHNCTHFLDLTENMKIQHMYSTKSHLDDKNIIRKLQLNLHIMKKSSVLSRSFLKGMVYMLLDKWIQQRKWGAVRLAVNFVPKSGKTWVYGQVLELADEVNMIKFMYDIVNMTRETSETTTLTDVLQQLMKRGLWGYMSKVLALNIKKKKKKQCCSTAILQACQLADDVALLRYILPVCLKDLAEAVVEILCQRELWSSLHDMLHRFEISPSLKAQAVERAASRAPDNVVCDGFLVFCPESLLQFVLKKAVERSFELTAARLLQNVVHNLLAGRCIKESYEALEEMFRLCQKPSVSLLFKNGSLKTIQRAVSDLQKVLPWKRPLCELLLLCLVQVLGGKSDKVCIDKGLDLFFCHAADFLQVVTTLSPTAAKKPKALAERMKAHFHSTSQDVLDPITFMNVEGFDCFSAFVAIKYFVKVYGRCRKDDALFTVLAMFPIVPLVQNVAIRLMLRQKRWNVIRQASLTHIWEHVRRELFQAAVEQGQWSLVKQWADYTLYDDQRWCSVNVAYDQKQWDVMFPLADFGLTVSEVMSVHYRLALHADWKTARKLLERGCEVSELKELVMNVHNTRRKDKPSRAAQSERYATLVKQDESWKSKMKTKSFSVTVRRKKWSLVLHWLRKIPHSRRLAFALNEAIRQEMWLIVIQLVRLGIPQSQREELFKQMMEMKQWAVCRVLLETSHFDEEFLVPHLPDLVARSQWILVSRVIDQGVDDTVLENIMQTAMDRREGSLVWHCLARLGNKVTKEQRQELLQRAWCREMWQAVRCLLEVQPEISDSMLQSAVDHEQWDLIDHCETHKADVNIKDGNGETYLHRAARQRHWRAVRELVSRDADPNMADSDGFFPLHQACQNKEWSTVDLLIQYLADLSAVDRYERTPLMMIIDSRQGKIIERALMWSNKLQGKNRTGETALHVMCRCRMPEVMYYLIRRGVYPFAVTDRGKTVLRYAADDEACPERMVAECIKLGLSTRQAHVSLVERFKEVSKGLVDYFLPYPSKLFGNISPSPFEYALTHSRYEMCYMLYESGTVSNCEIFNLRNLDDSEKPRPDNKNNTAVLSYLEEKASTPRSLESCCRLVISHCLGFRCRREQNALCLDLPERMTQYVLFQDLTDKYINLEIPKTESDPEKRAFWQTTTSLLNRMEFEVQAPMHSDDRDSVSDSEYEYESGEYLFTFVGSSLAYDSGDSDKEVRNVLFAGEDYSDDESENNCDNDFDDYIAEYLRTADYK